MATISVEQFRQLANAGYEAYGRRDAHAAESHLVAAVEMARELRIRDMALASVLNMLSGVQRATGREDEALPTAIAAFEIMEHECEPGDRDLIGVARNVAQMAASLGHREESLKWSRRAFELSAHASPPERINAAIAYSDVLAGAGRPGEAVDLLVSERDLMLRYLSSPPESFDQLAAPMGEMIKEEYRTQRREPPALLLLRIKLTGLRHALGQDDDSVATLPEMGTFEARTHGEVSAELGEQYQEVGVALHLLAQQTGKREHFAKAREYYQRSLKILQQTCDDEDRHLRRARSNLAELEDDVRKLT